MSSWRALPIGTALSLCLLISAISAVSDEAVGVHADQYPVCQPGVDCTYTTAQFLYRWNHFESPYMHLNRHWKSIIGDRFEYRWKHRWQVWLNHHQGKTDPYRATPKGMDPDMCDKQLPLECDWRHFVAGWNCGLPGWRSQGPNGCLHGPSDTIATNILRNGYVKLTLVCGASMWIASKMGPEGEVFWERSLIMGKVRGCMYGGALGWLYDKVVGT